MVAPEDMTNSPCAEPPAGGSARRRTLWRRLIDHYHQKLDGGGRGTVLATIIGMPAILLAALIGAGATVYIGSNGDKSEPPGSTPSTNVSNTAKTPPTPSATNPSATLSASPPECGESADCYSPGPPRRLVLVADCNAHQFIDLDIAQVRRMQTEEWDNLTSEEAHKFDLYIDRSGCWNVEARTGRQIGLLPKGESETVESCQQAALGGGFSTISLHHTDWGEMKEAGFDVGTSICLISDQKNIVMAKLTRVTWPSTARLTFEVTVWKHR